MARSEIRQFLLALVAVAVLALFIVSPTSGIIMMASDLVLVFCGAWFANQIVRGRDVVQRQMLVVARTYLCGLLSCLIGLAIVAWLFFLPQELANLGREAAFSALFLTNAAAIVGDMTVDTNVRGFFDHLWLPASIAQGCLFLYLLFGPINQNKDRLLALAVFIALAVFLLLSGSNEDLRMFIVGGALSFLLGAFTVMSYFSLGQMRYATPLGISFIALALLMIGLSPDTAILNRAMLAGAVAFLFLGSLPRKSSKHESDKRVRQFSFFVHFFIWSLPVVALVDLAFGVNSILWNRIFAGLITIVLGYASWSFWSALDKSESSKPSVLLRHTVLLSAASLAVAVPLYVLNGIPQRLPAHAQTLLGAVETSGLACSTETQGVLKGLNSCQLGNPAKPPEVLVWGDDHALAMHSVFDASAKSADIGLTMVASKGCIPLIGLQTRSHRGAPNIASCEWHSKQLIQAIAHMPSLTSVVIVGDWSRYAPSEPVSRLSKDTISLAPNDGTPFDPTDPGSFVADAAKTTIETLQEMGLSVTVLREPPVQPRFDTHRLARSGTPGYRMLGTPDAIPLSISLETAERVETPLKSVFQSLHAQRQIRLIDPWPLLCDEATCRARGALASYYATPTLLSRSGAWMIQPLIEETFTTSQLRRQKMPAANGA